MSLTRYGASLRPFCSLHQTPPLVNHSIVQQALFLRNPPLFRHNCRILLAAGAGACYKPTRDMKLRLIAPVLAVALLVAPAAAQNVPVAAPMPLAAEEEQEPDEPTTEEELEAADAAAGVQMEEADAQLSTAAAQTLEATHRQMDALAVMVAAVVDAGSAEALAPMIAAAYEALLNVDFSSLSEEDEELVAAEFAEDMFIRMDEELARLADADYFGNAALRKLFGIAEEAPAHKPAAPQPRPAEPHADSPVIEAGTESTLSH